MDIKNEKINKTDEELSNGDETQMITTNNDKKKIITLIRNSLIVLNVMKTIAKPEDWGEICKFISEHSYEELEKMYNERVEKVIDRDMIELAEIIRKKNTKIDMDAIAHLCGDD